jgi:hypothetical protein
VPTVTFQDGPCKGQATTVTTTQLASGSVECGGVSYQIQGLAPNLYVAYETAGGGTGGIGTLAPDLLAGYADLQKAVTRDLWPALERVQRYNTLALNALKPTRKLRGR